MQLVQSHHFWRSLAKIAENAIQYAEKIVHWCVLIREGVRDGLKMQREWEARRFETRTSSRQNSDKPD